MELILNAKLLIHTTWLVRKSVTAIWVTSQQTWKIILLPLLRLPLSPNARWKSGREGKWGWKAPSSKGDGWLGCGRDAPLPGSVPQGDDRLVFKTKIGLNLYSQIFCYGSRHFSNCCRKIGCHWGKVYPISLGAIWNTWLPRHAILRQQREKRCEP